MPFVLPLWAYFAVSTPACAFAFLRGDGELRIASAYCGVMPVILVTIPIRHDPRFLLIWASLDLVLFFALALRSSRWWTLVMASISLVNVITTTTLFFGFSLWAVGTAQLVWDGVGLVTLVVAARDPRRAVRRRPLAQPG